MNARKLCGIILVLLLSLAGCGGQVETIRIGGIFDLTGPTSDVGVPYADGVRDYIDYVNAQGGINGRQVELIYEDYAYEVPRALDLYERLVEEENVLAILGWGTGDTEALREHIARDRIPLMSASYAESLSIIKEAPYNFLIGVTYSDQMRIALRYVEETWTDSSRRARVAFIYNDTAFGKAPLPAGREYAATHDIEIVAEIIVALSAQDASAQMEELGQANADYAIIQETAGATSTILRDAHRLGLTMQFIGLNWAADEKTIALTGEAAEGFMGTVPFSFIYEEGPGTAEIRAYQEQQGGSLDDLSIRYVAGWATAKVMLEGTRLAGDDLTGSNIRQVLETLQGHDTGGLTAPITFSATSHKGARALRIYQVQDGRWVPISNYIEAVQP